MLAAGLSSLAVDDVPNLVDGADTPAVSGEWLEKARPADGTPLYRFARSGAEDVARAVEAARRSQPAWARETPVARGDLVREIALAMRERREELSELVAAETGKSMALARGETDAAIEMGLFVAGEGRRLYGRTTTASMPHRSVSAVRVPVGVAALLMSFNTPLPNIAWKAFPAVLCGNAAVVKPSEEVPGSATRSRGSHTSAGCPAASSTSSRGSGRGGRRLVAHPDVDLVSFTGSAATGRRSTRSRRVASRRCAWSSAARTRSSSATTPTSTGPSAGRSPRPSRTRDSGVRRRAGSSSSTRSTTTSASACSRARRSSSRSR